MSAFIHNPEHVIAIVASAARLNLGPLKVGRTVYDLTNPVECDSLCRRFYAANVRSVNSRYSERTALAMPSRYHTAGDYARMSAAALCKAIDSLDYQSCERPDWATSLAGRLLTQLHFLTKCRACPPSHLNVEDTTAYKTADVWSITK